MNCTVATLTPMILPGISTEILETDPLRAVLASWWSRLDIETKKKSKKSCCEKFRKGKRCKSCPMKGCA
jgi:hypothetical protein